MVQLNFSVNTPDHIALLNSMRPGDAYVRHYQNKCWNIVNWNLRDKLKWNLKRNSYIFLQENAFENVVWKMAAILSWPQGAKITTTLFMALKAT